MGHDRTEQQQQDKLTRTGLDLGLARSGRVGPGRGWGQDGPGAVASSNSVGGGWTETKPTVTRTLPADVENQRGWKGPGRLWVSVCSRAGTPLGRDKGLSIWTHGHRKGGRGGERDTVEAQMADSSEQKGQGTATNGDLQRMR